MVKLVNAVTDAYMEEVVNEDNNRRKERLGKLKKILDELTEKMSNARRASKKLAERAGSSDRKPWSTGTSWRCSGPTTRSRT